MDWIGPGDHDYGYGQDYLWWITQKQVDLYRWLSGDMGLEHLDEPEPSADL